MIRLIALFLTLILASCGDKNDSEQSKPKSSRDVDAVLLQDLEKAGDEFEHRLVTRISVKDGLLLVRRPYGGEIGGLSFVLPANSPWVLSCGWGGLHIAIGNAVSGTGSETSTDVELYLTNTEIEESGCDTLGPRLGKRLKSILENAAESPR